MTRVVIDTDPGIDDAIALLLALASPELDVVGLTTVAGNVGLDHTTRNALGIAQLAGRADLPVSAGANRPLVHDARRAEHVHGADGVGGVRLPEPTAPPDPRHAVDLIAALAEPAPLTLVAIGPLTNVALLLARYPRVAERIERLVIMGGSTGTGNATGLAEFNIWVDPEAAVRVLASGCPITLLPLDATRQALLGPADVEALGLAGGHCPAIAAALLRAYGDLRPGGGLIMHDALAMVELIDPGLIGRAPRRITVDDGHGPTRGRTAAADGIFNAEVAETVDQAGFARLVVSRIGAMP